MINKNLHGTCTACGNTIEDKESNIYSVITLNNHLFCNETCRDTRYRQCSVCSEWIDIEGDGYSLSEDFEDVTHNTCVKN